MGYTKIYQFGNITEVYEYEKDINTTRKTRHTSKIQRNRKKAIKARSGNIRSKYSISRARRSFFRLCHENNLKAQTIHFLTLTLADDTDYTTATRYISQFFNKLRKHETLKYSEISYIGVPELTKKGTYHFHLLLYNLRPETAIRERETRNLQRKCWQRGYLEIGFAPTVTQGLAGYMAKYMGKHLANPANEARRAYNCSRNIEKIRSYGSQTLDSYADLLIPDKLAERTASYTVPFLGTCQYEKYHVL